MYFEGSLQIKLIFPSRYNNYLFLKKRNSRIFLMRPHLYKQAIVYLKDNCLVWLRLVHVVCQL